MSALVFQGNLLCTAFIEVSFLHNSLISMASETYGVSPRGGTLQLGKLLLSDRDFPFLALDRFLSSLQEPSCKVFAHGVFSKLL